MPRLFLTNSFIYSVKCPFEKVQALYWDHPTGLDGKVRSGAQKGLGVRVTNKGAKAYIHSINFNGARRRMVVGDPSNMNIASARLIVQQRTNQFEDGIDPDVVRIDYRKKHKLLLHEISTAFFEQHLKSTTLAHQTQFTRFIDIRLSKQIRTPCGRRIKFESPIKDFNQLYGLWPVEDVGPQEVTKYLQKITSDSMANIARVHLKVMFNWAIRMQMIDMRNPVDPIKIRKIIKKRRDYSQEQVKAITKYVFARQEDAIEVVAGVGLARRDHALTVGRKTQQDTQMHELFNFMGILLLTMARPNEVKLAKFEHFDLEQLIWHKHNTKGLKLSHATYEYEFRSVPIHPRVAEIVKAQKERWPASELVFPSSNDQSLPRNNFTKGVRRFKELEGIPAHFQLYDLKRISISLMLTGQGVRREDISHYVDHKGNIETTMIYDLGFVDPMRPVAEKLGELLGLPTK